MGSNILLIFNLFILEGLLSVDNAAVLAVMVKDLPDQQSKKALRYGIVGAYVMRGLCLIFASYLMGVWWLKMCGGLYLLYLAYGLFSKKVEMIEEITDKKESFVYDFLSKKGISKFWATVILVEIMDLAFSIDNVFAAVALSNKLWVVFAGVFLGILAMRYIAVWFVDMIKKYPSLEKSSYIVISLLGGKLIVASMAEKLHHAHLLSMLENRYTDAILSIVMMIIFFSPIIKNRK